jgi:hypothetical protein
MLADVSVLNGRKPWVKIGKTEKGRGFRRGNPCPIEPLRRDPSSGTSRS